MMFYFTFLRFLLLTVVAQKRDQQQKENWYKLKITSHGLIF